MCSMYIYMHTSAYGSMQYIYIYIYIYTYTYKQINLNVYIYIYTYDTIRYYTIRYSAIPYVLYIPEVYIGFRLQDFEMCTLLTQQCAHTSLLLEPFILSPESLGLGFRV